jgi:hypothetical protein
LVESRLVYPVNLRIDLYNHRLYWLDYKLGKIETISIVAAGKQQSKLDRYIVYRFDEYFKPKQFDLFDDFLYVIGRNSSEGHKITNKILILHKYNKQILRDDVFGGSLREKKIDFKLESIEFSSILSHVYIMNPLKQPNDTFVYIRKFIVTLKLAL